MIQVSMREEERDVVVDALKARKRTYEWWLQARHTTEVGGVTFAYHSSW